MITFSLLQPELVTSSCDKLAVQNPISNFHSAHRHRVTAVALNHYNIINANDADNATSIMLEHPTSPNIIITFAEQSNREINIPQDILYNCISKNILSFQSLDNIKHLI